MSALALAASLTLLPAWAQTDKVAHAAVSANIITFGLNLMADEDNHTTWQDRVFWSGIALGIGFTKECTDPVFDPADMRANVAGVIIGNLINWRF